MSPADVKPVILTPHPSTPCDAVRAIEVRVHTKERGVLALEYALDADMARMRIPAQLRRQRTDELWKHTCFEAFIRTDESQGYYELNFSPSGEWGVYRFAAYRSGMAPAAGIGAPEITVRRGHSLLELTAATRFPIAAEAHFPAWRIALAAVIEDRDGRLSYWSLRAPPGKPDFHHSDSFALEIQP